MKKIILSGIAVISVFLFSKCTSNGDKTKTGDSTKIKTIPAELSDTIAPKHLAFFNDSILGEIKEKQDKYLYLIKNFKPVPEDKFEVYHAYFKTIFKIGVPGPIIAGFTPPAFSIYDKYTIFQSDLGIQTELVLRPSPGVPPVAFENRIRIYPAIDPGNVFYLVILAEEQNLSTMPKPDPLTNKNKYYSIIGSTFGPIATTKQQAETDILKFQTTWLNTVAPQNPGYQFDPIRSFTYSIQEYNELLSKNTGFWDWRNFQTDSKPKEMVQIYPIVVTDDPLYPLHARFKLVFVPYNETAPGTYARDNSRGFFDHMDVCPDKCPSNSIQ